MTAQQLARIVGFAASEAIQSGELDDYLDQLLVVIQARRRLYDMTRSPARTPEMVANGQVWAGMNGPGRPHWEVRGTGAMMSDPPESVEP
jgi:hypothetical protein